MNSAPRKTAAVPGDQLSRPSTARYRTLIETLQQIDQELLNGAHALRASIDAVQAVCQFIGEDVPLRQAGVSVTLRRLLAALDDTAVGAKPDWLFSGGLGEDQKEDGGKKPGRRVDLSDHTLRGVMVYALSGLIDAKMRNKDAAQLMEQMLSSAGALYQGKPITAANLIQWRKQTGDSAPRTADEAVRIVGQICAQRPASFPSTIQNQKLIAQMIASVVARYNSK
jgi:hypothetical protein